MVGLIGGSVEVGFEGVRGVRVEGDGYSSMSIVSMWWFTMDGEEIVI